MIICTDYIQGICKSQCKASDETQDDTCIEGGKKVNWIKVQALINSTHAEIGDKVAHISDVNRQGIIAGYGPCQITIMFRDRSRECYWRDEVVLIEVDKDGV